MGRRSRRGRLFYSGIQNQPWKGIRELVEITLTYLDQSIAETLIPATLPETIPELARLPRGVGCLRTR